MYLRVSIFVIILKVTEEKEQDPDFVIQWYGSANPDQNFTDLENWIEGRSIFCCDSLYMGKVSEP
jgi:hypothetical protein